MDCRWFKRDHCHSCELLSHTYEETLTIKEKKLKDLFRGFEIFLQPTVALKGEVQGSRNKAKLAVYGDQNSIQFGFYNSKAEFRDLEECPVHMQGINELLPLLKEKIQEYKILPYSVSEKKGELKYLMISKSQSHGGLLLRFTLRSKESLDRLKKMAELLEFNHPEIKVITANIQPEHKAVMEGAEEIVLTKNHYILHQFDDVQLTLGPRSFFQVTPKIAGELYQSVGRLLDEKKIKSFLDLFCGVGAFSFFAAKSCPDVLGVEISKEAIFCAESSKSFNKVMGQVHFKALDVEEFLKNLDKNFEGILVNPPRRGLNPSIVQNILKQRPRVIIYSSCNAETLIRDFLDLSVDYSIATTQVFDMFPYTEHFETLMVLTRKDA